MNNWEVVALVCVILGNIIWYTIKHILGKNGFKTNLFSAHFRDLSNWFELISQEENDQSVCYYKGLLYVLLICIIILVVSFFMIISNIP